MTEDVDNPCPGREMTSLVTLSFWTEFYSLPGPENTTWGPLINHLDESLRRMTNVNVV